MAGKDDPRAGSSSTAVEEIDPDLSGRATADSVTVY